MKLNRIVERFFVMAMACGLFLVTLPSSAQDPVYGGAHAYPQPGAAETAVPVSANRPAAGNSTLATEFMTGFASFLVTPVYGVFKVVFAGLGALTGGMAWAFSGGDTALADKIWRPAIRGTYIITPDHLAGRKPVRFIGR